MVKSTLLAVCFGALIGCDESVCDSLSPCDIRTADCQEQVMEVMACLRRTSPVRARVQVKNTAAFLHEQVQALDEEPVSDAALDWYRGLALLNLMPPALAPEELVQKRWQDVTAFYSSETKRVTVLDRGQGLDGGGGVLQLAHEFVHVLQDEAGDLESAAGHDAELAARAVREGEATLYRDLADLQGHGWKPSNVDWPHVFAELEWHAWNEAIEEPALYERSAAVFANGFGLGYVGAAYQRSDTRELEDAVSRAPGSTREVLGRYRGGPPFDGGWSEDMSDVARPLLPDTWTLVHVERAGAFLFELLRQRQRAAEFKAERYLPDVRATGWAGDSLSVYRDDSGNLRLYWRVRFLSVEQAENAQSYLENPAWQVELRDRDAIISAASEGVEPSEVYEDWGPAPDDESALDSGVAPLIQLQL